MRAVRALAVAVVAVLTPAAASAVTVLDADFDADESGFVYLDDTFRGTGEPDYASGAWNPGGGFAGGGLEVALGGIDGADIVGMSGGWRATFSLAAPEELELTFRYQLTQTPEYEDDEISQVLVTVDGALLGTGGADFVAEIRGDDAGGPDRTTGWRVFRAPLGLLHAGTHTVTVGGYNNEKTQSTEATTVRIDDVVIATPVPTVPNPGAEAVVAALDPVRFEDNIATLAAFGTRFWEQQGNLDATDWIEAELASYGYTVERHAYVFSGEMRDNVYVTKVGSVHPDRMYIVSAHFDSYNSEDEAGAFAPGADDDASGTSLVLEAARVFAPPEVTTDVSVRFILWNNEETGLNGSNAYVLSRRNLQGVEEPPGSGQYPEPTWLGIVQHDMILFDHGLPPQANQIAAADIDVEYQSGADFVGDSIDLAAAVFDGNVRYAADYPAEVSSNMDFTDSRSFWGDCAAVSVRENRRVAEIGEGANPHWHKPTDVVSTFSAADYLLGFNTVQTTVGAIAELAGAAVVQCGDGVVATVEGCDDGDTDPGDGCDGSCVTEPGWTCASEPSICAVCRPSGLTFPLPGNVGTLGWTAPSPGVCPGVFDVARGSLGDLVSTGSVAGATCLEDDLAGTQAYDGTLLFPGSGYWYLVRVDGDSWNDLGGTQAIDRDPALATCP